MSSPDPSQEATEGTATPAPPKEDGPKVIPLIQGIRNGTVSPRTITAADRQLCLQEFLLEGMSYSEAAMILKCSERTVYRDLKALRRKRALGPNDLRAMEVLGNLCHELNVSAGKARRAARDKNARPDDKIEAERLASQSHLQFVTLLARFGFIKASNGKFRLCIDLDGNTVPPKDRKRKARAADGKQLGVFGLGRRPLPQLPE